METIEGFYDGKRILPLRPIRDTRHRRVRITLMEEITPEEEVRIAASQSDAFEFWNDPREDLYQDLAKRLQKESAMTAKESMNVLREFEELG